jgi:glycosyltransferase involved in cell wall biosynthesis
MPGQALRGFEAARARGIPTVLNHATGPIRDWIRIMEPEYHRVGLRLTDICPYDQAYLAREGREYALADFHCAASTVVRDQLLNLGIPPNRILLAPYGADPAIFHSRDRALNPSPFRIAFAGQLGLRKDIRTLLNALETLNRPDWQMHFYGGTAPEAHHDLESYTGSTPLTFHGAVSQPDLARAFRNASILVLPSLEEGFGLVIPQALNCGLPCIVSDRVGAKDLIRHRDNGSIFPCADSTALANEITWWSHNWRPVDDVHNWSTPARTLIEATTSALRKSS